MKFANNIITTILCCLGMTTIMSCQGSLYYADFRDMPSLEWDSRDTLSFTVPAPQHDTDMSLTVAVRHTPAYKYESITVHAIAKDSVGCLISRDLKIKATPDGKGSKQGAVYTDSRSMPVRLHMKAGHGLTIRLAHRMRLNPLQGISNVEVTLDRIEK